MEIRTLEPGDESAARAALEALGQSSDGPPFFLQWDGTSDFGEYCRRLTAWSRGEDLPEHFVRSTFLVGFVKGQLVSRVSIRHELNDRLRDFGGHIGYHTVPGHEGKGYASALFRHALTFCYSLGISEAMVTCHPENHASRHIIESASGRFEKDHFSEIFETSIRVYWVPTSGGAFLADEANEGI